MRKEILKMSKVYKYINEEERSFDVPEFKGKTFHSDFLHIYRTGRVVIPKGYAWNGCSPKFVVLDTIVGTPDGNVGNPGVPKTLYASMIHDALYQYKAEVPITRKEADLLFYKMIKENKFLWSNVYYRAVRIFGRFLGKWKTK